MTGSAAANRPRLVDTANFLLATRDSGYRSTAYAVAEFDLEWDEPRADRPARTFPLTPVRTTSFFATLAPPVVEMAEQVDRDVRSRSRSDAAHALAAIAGVGAITTRGVLYSATNSNPTLDGVGMDVNRMLDGAGGTGTFSEMVSGLTPGATYYYVAFATNSVIGPMYATGLTLFYYDQRVRKEGYDIERMMEHADGL